MNPDNPGYSEDPLLENLLLLLMAAVSIGIGVVIGIVIFRRPDA